MTLLLLLAILASPQAPNSLTAAPESQIGRFVLFSVTHKDGTTRIMRLDTSTGATWHQCFDSTRSEIIKNLVKSRENSCKDKNSEKCKKIEMVFSALFSDADTTGTGINKWCLDEEE